MTTKSSDRADAFADRTSDSPVTRERPIPVEMIPPAEMLHDARSYALRSGQDALDDALDIDLFPHPIVRALCATSLIEELTEVLRQLSDLRRLAIADAYEEGHEYSGWYGYAAIAGQVDLSPSRVRQIIFDITTDGRNGSEVKRDTEATDIRPRATSRRKARALITKGIEPEVISEQVGLTLQEVRRLARAMRNEERMAS